jgi:ribose transport system ATP-binding protein
MNEAPDLKISGLNKWFGTNQVLRDIDLEIRPGDFLGLMGPNGAGKSTLIKILDGVYTASSGEITLGGERVEKLGGRNDVGFIHQDLGLVDEMSIVDNLRLGEDPLRLVGPILNKRAERAAAEHALSLVGLDIPSDVLVGELAPGEKTLVAIARVFDRGASIIFVDEATSTLPPTEARRVIDSLAVSAAAGATIVMVTHKLSEILDATKRVVVLLDGRLAADEPTAGLDRAALVRMLLQYETAQVKEVAGPVGEEKPAEPGGDVLLDMQGVYGGRAGPVDLQLRAGEILGLTGLPASGLHDVAFLACGAMKPTGGTVRLAHNGVRRAFVPPHREAQGGFATLSVRENLTLSALGRWKTKMRTLAVRREAVDSAEMVERLSVKPALDDTEFGVLSGGNKQKVIFGRALLQEPHVYVLCEPTRGVDVGTRSEIYRLIRELAEHGAGVLVVSSDSEDLFAVCDRVGVVQASVSDLRAVKDMQLSELETIL